MPNIFREFLEGDNGRGSMTRLLTLLSFPAATWMTIKLDTETALTIYMATYAATYLGGKTADAFNRGKDNSVGG